MKTVAALGLAWAPGRFPVPDAWNGLWERHLVVPIHPAIDDAPGYEGKPTGVVCTQRAWLVM